MLRCVCVARDVTFSFTLPLLDTFLTSPSYFVCLLTHVQYISSIYTTYCNLDHSLAFPQSIPFYFNLFQTCPQTCIQPLLLSLLYSLLSSIVASNSGACTTDGSSPLSPLREQKVYPLPLRFCVMEHREIETDGRRTY